MIRNSSNTATRTNIQWSAWHHPHVFKQKICSLINYIVKQHVFGISWCWMYSTEWKKRGLTHAHILIWLVKRTWSDQIDDIIWSEISDPKTNPDLKQIIHGPCGTINCQSPCMGNGKCSKRYPRKFTAETITGNDGYPLYWRQSPNDNGRTITRKLDMPHVIDFGHCSCEIRNYGSSCYFWNTGHVVRRMPYSSFSVKIAI